MLHFTKGGYPCSYPENDIEGQLMLLSS